MTKVTCVLITDCLEDVPTDKKKHFPLRSFRSVVTGGGQKWTRAGMAKTWDSFVRYSTTWHSVVGRWEKRQLSYGGLRRLLRVFGAVKAEWLYRAICGQLITHLKANYSCPIRRSRCYWSGGIYLNKLSRLNGPGSNQCCRDSRVSRPQ